MELVKVGEKTYYNQNATNIEIYKLSDKDIYFIDTGNDKDAGKKILKLVTEQGWNVKGIINTHSHADHIGGNKVIQDRTGCVILASSIERAFTEFPELEPSFLYGSYPFKELRNKSLQAKASVVTPLENHLPEGLEVFSLKGHSFDMIGIKTSDDVYFLADAIFSEETIMKYHFFFIYDVREYLNTLNVLKTLKGKLFIPAHCEATTDISSLIALNEKKIEEVLHKIYEICAKPMTFEEILKYLFDEYHLDMNVNQFVLVESTIKSYLSYLQEEQKICYEFKDNKMLWKQTSVEKEKAIYG